MRFSRLHTVVLGLSLLAICGIFVVLSTPAAHAQADLGTISGTITDTTGAVIPKAQVTITNAETGAVRVTITGSRGEYSVSQLIPATYTVNISAAGFAAATQKVNVTVGSQNAVSAKLAVAGGKTEIVVEADDFASVQLEKPEVSAVIETNQILSLPTLDRNPYNLVAFSGNLSADPTATSRGVGFNISGLRSTSVDILLDGAENTDFYAMGIGQSVPLDATQEIRIVTSNSGAEYGRGAGAVNVSTKSGTNQIHGSVYEFNRISTLASDGYNNNYLNAVYGSQAKPRYTHNQPGYSIGGPIKKDKLFFFSSTEWTYIRSAQNIITTVPTPDLIAMSGSAMQSYFNSFGTLAHPIVSGSEITGADIQATAWGDKKATATAPVSYGDITQLAVEEYEAANNLTTYTPSALNCSDPHLAAMPACSSPLFGESIYSYAADSGGGVPVDQWITFNRADWTINQTTSMFGRYIQESAVNPAGSINNSPYQGFDTGQTQYNHSLELSLSKAFSPTLASATKVLATRFNNAQPLDESNKGCNSENPCPTLYINGGSPVSLNGGYINFPGYSQTSPGNALPFGGPQNFIQFGEDVAWTKGKHQLTFGGTYLYIKDNRSFGAYEEAVDGLSNAGTSGTAGALYNFVHAQLGLLQVATYPQGEYPCYRDALGNYIQTAACTLTLPVTEPSFSRSNRFDDESLYVNDSYKVSNGLTVNLGLRWEIYGPQHSQKASYDSNFFPDYTQGNPWDQIRDGQIKTRETSPNGRLWNQNMKQFGPKVGFAWDPFGNGKTSVRGGYGISYERNFNNVTFNVIQNPPNQAVLAFTKTDNGGNYIPMSANNFAQFGGGTGSKALPNVNLRAVDPRMPPSYAQNWSLSVERQFAGTTASISYVGTRGIHQYSIENINRSFDGNVYEGDPVVSVDAGTGLPTEISSTGNRSNYQYASINYRGADGDSYYHGLTAEVRSSNLYHTGLTVRADYTWSHSIDNNSSTFNDSENEAGGGLVLGYTDAWMHSLDRGSADFDQRHRVATTLVWDVPFGKHLTGASKLIGDGWTLATTFDAQTGTPFSEYDCGFNLTVCPRTSFASAVPRKKQGGMTDISGIYGPNTYSYFQLPAYDPFGEYNEQLNPDVNAWEVAAYNASTGKHYTADTAMAGSDSPICSGIHGEGCHLVSGMDGRNSFSGPGYWHENFGVVKDFKVRERYDVQLKGEFINIFNHANTYLNLGGLNDVSYYGDGSVFAYKSGNRNTELSVHIQF